MAGTAASGTTAKEILSCFPFGIMQRHYLQWAYSIMAPACYLHAILLPLPALHSFQHRLTFTPVPTIVSYNVNHVFVIFSDFLNHLLPYLTSDFFYL